KDFSNSIIIYPNPVKNILTIDGLVVQDVVIYSVLGKEVLKISNQNRVNVSSLSKGVYFIKVSDGINASTKKFIKN
ncbi:MAG: T9SS type A sorting domain-containing protein, partial [Polaribacter sp.]